MPFGRARWVPIGLAISLSLGACIQHPDLTLPSAEEVESHYTSGAELHATINGNVAEVTVRQPSGQLARGGSLWGKVGPYIYLFSDQTRQLFEDYPGLAGVRLTTRTASGEQIANALLKRDELSDILWRRSLHIAGLARRDGTDRPGLLDDLVRWGEQHTDYHYNRRYTS